MDKKGWIAVPFSIIVLILMVACGNGPDEKKAEIPEKKKPFSWIRNIIGNFSSQDTIFIDSSYVDQFIENYPHFKDQLKDIRKFYKDRNFAYAWYDGRGIIEQAENLVNRVQNIEYDGLQDSLPYISRLDDLMEKPNRKKTRQELELMLTSQYFSLANIVWKGLDEKDVKKLGWYIPRKKLSARDYLDSMLTVSDNEFLETEPVNKQYEDLRNQLRRTPIESQRAQRIVTVNPQIQKNPNLESNHGEF